MSLRYKMKNLYPWRIIFFDESVILANISASVTQYWMRGERPDYQVRVGMTGEPAPEKCLQFATQYMIVFGEFMGYTSYMQYYQENWRTCDYTGKDVLIRPSHEAEIREYVQKTAHCVTMKSLGLGSEFLYNVAFFELNSTQKRLMREVKKLRDEGKKLIGVPFKQNPSKLKACSMERLISAGLHPKDHSLISRDKLNFLITCYKDSGEPMIILSHYKAPLFELERMLKKQGIPYGLVYGSSGTPSQKQALVDDFQDGLFNVFLGQTSSVKMNYDLSRSSITYYYSNSYKRDDRAQSEKRTTNLRKKIPVGIMDLCYRDTMDEPLVKKLRAKEKVSYSFIDKEFENACFIERG